MHTPFVVDPQLYCVSAEIRNLAVASGRNRATNYNKAVAILTNHGVRATQVKLSLQVEHLKSFLLWKMYILLIIITVFCITMYLIVSLSIITSLCCTRKAVQTFSNPIDLCSTNNYNDAVVTTIKVQEYRSRYAKYLYCNCTRVVYKCH